MMDQDKIKEAYHYCIFLLSRQNYSAYKLKQKLKLKGHEKTTIDSVVATLQEKNYLQEEEYRRSFIKKWILKSNSNNLIKMRANHEKIEVTDAEIEALRAELGSDKSSILQTTIEKKLGSRPVPTDFNERQKLKEKLTRFLVSKGFGWDDIQVALRPFFP